MATYAPTTSGSGADAGFTLIELLVVISIMSLLASMVLMGVSVVRDSAKSLQCQSNLRQAGIAMLGYATDNEGFLPSKLDGANYHPDAPLMDDYLPLSDKAWLCTSRERWKSTYATFPFTVHWALSSGSTWFLGPGFVGAGAAALARVQRTTDALLIADLDFARRGGYHNSRTNMCMIDGHSWNRSDQGRSLPYSATITWADPSPTIWGEYGSQKSLGGGQWGLKGWAY